MIEAIRTFLFWTIAVPIYAIGRISSNPSELFRITIPVPLWLFMASTIFAIYFWFHGGV